MKNARNYWSSHLAAIKTQGVATSKYASQHGILRIPVIVTTHSGLS